MKARIVILAFILIAGLAKAGNPYRNYLVSETRRQVKFFLITAAPEQIKENDILMIPRYQIPAGAVFCRLEDKLTRATRVWIKIGVK